MVEFNHYVYEVKNNKFYKIVMKKEYTGQTKNFTVLGDGLEGLINGLVSAGYYVNGISQL
ncbi:hypothetical protein ACWA2B_10765 [Paenibacillus sp. CMM36]